jgi:hypothetical protein
MSLAAPVEFDMGPFDSVNDDDSDFSLEQVNFGLAIESGDMPSGILGAAYANDYNQDYNGFIDEMCEQGIIKDRDFSVALGSVDENDGRSRIISQSCFVRHLQPAC